MGALRRPRSSLPRRSGESPGLNYIHREEAYFLPSIAITRPYEAIYIVDPNLGDEQVTVITDKYKQLVETNGGTVEKIDVWERRKLAYEIKGRNEGIYVVMQFTGQAKVETELRRIFQISEDQIRYMIVKQDDTAPLLPVAPTEPAAAVSAPPAAAPVPPAVAETPQSVAAEAAETTPTEAPVDEPELTTVA
jgi:small subunit ribosomal protein S6